jgi:hypothetical protein
VNGWREGETNAPNQSHENFVCQSFLEIMRARHELRSASAKTHARRQKELQPRHPVQESGAQTREILLNFFNRVSGNNRAASVYGDDAKSKNPGRSARISGQMSSLRTAIGFGANDLAYGRWCHHSHCHSHWTEQDAQKTGASSFS